MDMRPARFDCFFHKVLAILTVPSLAFLPLECFFTESWAIVAETHCTSQGPLCSGVCAPPGPLGAHLGLTWATLGPHWDAQVARSDLLISGEIRIVRLSGLFVPSFAPLLAPWGAPWGSLGPPWGHIGFTGASLFRRLRPSWPPGGSLGPPWGKEQHADWWKIGDSALPTACGLVQNRRWCSSCSMRTGAKSAVVLFLQHADWRKIGVSAPLTACGPAQNRR